MSASSILKYGVAVAAVVYLLGSGQLRASDLRLRDSGVASLLAGSGLLLVTLLLTCVRYWVIVRAAKVELDLPACIRLGMIGGFFNTILLGGVGGDAVKLVLVSRATKSRAVALSSVLIDRVIGLLALLTLGGLVHLGHIESVVSDPALLDLSLTTFAVLVAALWCTLAGYVALSRDRTAALLAWVGVALVLGAGVAHGLSRASIAEPVRHKVTAILACDALLALLCLLAAPSCQEGRTLERLLRRMGTPGAKVLSLIRSVLIYRDSMTRLAVSFAISLLSHAMAVYAVFVLSGALALNRPPDLRAVYLAAPLALITNALPVPGGGIGIGEAAFDHLLRRFGSAPAGTMQGGAAIFLVFRLVTIAIGLLGLPFYLSDREMAVMKPDSPES